MRPKDEARFWSKVDRTGPDECWLWTCRTNRTGYGRFSLEGREVLAHRVSRFLADGMDHPPEVFVCHHCDNPPCVNPAHLFLGTHDDNMRDMVRKGRAKPGFSYADATHCRRGHELTPENTNTAGGGRRCKTCWYIAFRKWRRAKAVGPSTEPEETPSE